MMGCQTSNENVITVIGHVCRDLVEGKYVAGSGVVYGAKCLLAYKYPCQIMTKYNPVDDNLFTDVSTHESMKMFLNLGKDSSDMKTTTFENTYPDGNPDKRVQVVHTRASLFSSSDLAHFSSPIALPSNIIIVTPLCGEFPEALLESLPSLGFSTVVLDVQGYTRYVTPEKTVIQRDWAEKGKYLKYVTILKTDNKEGGVLVGTEDLRKSSIALLGLGVKIIVATCADGVLISRLRDPSTSSSSSPPSSLPFEPLDSDTAAKYDFQWNTWGKPLTPECRTGRGDTTLFSFVYFYCVRKCAFAEAAALTARVVNAKMQAVGALSSAVLEKSGVLQLVK